MQKWQKNAILRTIQGTGLDPQQFIFEDDSHHTEKASSNIGGPSHVLRSMTTAAVTTV
jgi:hypothetical protein